MNHPLPDAALLAHISPTSSGLEYGLKQLIDMDLIEKRGDLYYVADGL